MARSLTHLALVLTALLVAGPLRADLDGTLLVDPRDHLAGGIALSVVADDGGITLGPGGATSLHTSRGVFQSPPMTLDAPFDVVLFSYAGKVPDGTSATFMIRALADGGASRWHMVGREGEAVFDAPATALQYRIILEGGESTPVIGSLSLTTVLRRPDAPVVPDAPSTAPTATVTAPAIVEREAWGARPPSDAYGHHEVRIIVVHHTAIPTAADYQGAATVRGIQRSHMDERHWIDLGYHFLIGPEGTVFRGRPVDAVGAHCPPNTGRVGVSVVGDYMTEQVSDASMASLTSLLSFLCSSHALSPDRIFAHRDFSTSLCPGDGLYGRLDEVRRAVSALLTSSSSSSSSPPRRRR